MSTTFWCLGLATLVGGAIVVSTYMCAPEFSLLQMNTESTTTTVAATSKHNEPCCNHNDSTKVVSADGAQCDQFSCALNPDQLASRIAETQQIILSQAQEVIELKNGYRFRFAADDTMIQRLTDWIIAERKCCPFFQFTLIVEPEGRLWFELAGEPGVKEFIGRILKPEVPTEKKNSR